MSDGAQVREFSIVCLRTTPLHALDGVRALDKYLS